MDITELMSREALATALLRRNCAAAAQLRCCGAPHSHLRPHVGARPAVAEPRDVSLERRGGTGGGAGGGTVEERRGAVSAVEQGAAGSGQYTGERERVWRTGRKNPTPLNPATLPTNPSQSSLPGGGDCVFRRK